MEKDPVVQSIFDVFDHVANGDRSPLREQFDNDCSGYFVLKMSWRVGDINSENWITEI